MSTKHYRPKKREAELGPITQEAIEKEESKIYGYDYDLMQTVPALKEHGTKLLLGDRVQYVIHAGLDASPLPGRIVAKIKRCPSCGKRVQKLNAWDEGMRKWFADLVGADPDKLG